MAFSEGQRVRFARMDKPAKVLSGPHRTSGTRERYLIEKADGTVSLVDVRELSEVDTRVDEIAALIWSTVHPALSPLSNAGPSARARYQAAAEAVIAKLAEPVPLKVGDQIRILASYALGATVRRGDLLSVMSVSDDSFTTDAPRAAYSNRWTFSLASEGIAWERVARG